jgi:hypothetical protein
MDIVENDGMNGDQETLIFYLQLGDEIVATIDVYLYEFPFFHGEIISIGSFERYRSYFSEGGQLGEWLSTTTGEEVDNEIAEKGDFIVLDPKTKCWWHTLIFSCDGTYVSFRGIMENGSESTQRY